MFPVRCFTCGKVIGHLWESYQEKLREGKTPKEALDELSIDRYCCRRMFLTYKSVIKEFMKFKGAVR
ncbi:DNA-directed RNA polymerase subunit N [Archaeoglobus sulfaticallidus]|uniref:DNA-directed RNA polymerase subunit N n=1 Tax=Archaeoglobus sulfaticallidus TaxID=1316941 RepID=UPI0009DA1727|nr:DNA-directed RNA polymerase subunit N [Archaeoglobus sulfaticallidus]